MTNRKLDGGGAAAAAAPPLTRRRSVLAVYPTAWHTHNAHCNARVAFAVWRLGLAVFVGGLVAGDGRRAGAGVLTQVGVSKGVQSESSPASLERGWVGRWRARDSGIGGWNWNCKVPGVGRLQDGDGDQVRRRLLRPLRGGGWRRGNGAELTLLLLSELDVRDGTGRWT